MSLEIKGRITEIGEIQNFNEGKFSKKQILLTVKDGAYEQVLPIDVSNKNIGIFDSFNVGDAVMVDINLRSNEWQGKHYPSINGWRVAAITDDSVADAAPAATTATDPVATEPTDAPADTATDGDGDDDLPF